MCMSGGLWLCVPTILVVASLSFVLLTISITKNMQIQYSKSSSLAVLTQGLNDTSGATLLQAGSSLKEDCERLLDPVSIREGLQQKITGY